MKPNVKTWHKPTMEVLMDQPAKTHSARHGGRRHHRSATKTLRIWPDEVLQCIVRHLPPDDMRTVARLAMCSRQWHRVIIQDADFGRRLYRAAYLLGAPEERDWLRWWLKDAKAIADRVDRENDRLYDTGLEVNWPRVFLARRQLEAAWRTGAQVDGEAIVGVDGRQDWPLRPRLRQVRLPVEKGERVSVLASSPAGAVLHVAREGRVIVLEHRAGRAPRVYELSDKGMQGMPGVLTTAPPRVLRGRGMRHNAFSAARIPGLADARMNDRFVVLLVAESIAAAVTAGHQNDTDNSMFITPKHTLCVWKTGHQHMAYRVDNFPAIRLVSLRGRWLVVPRGNNTNGANNSGTTPILGSVSHGYTVFDLARHATEVGNFGSSFGRGCVQASDDRSLLVYACGVVGPLQQLLWEQWSVKSVGEMHAEQMASPTPSPRQMQRHEHRRASRTGMLPIEDVERDDVRVYAVDADRVLVLYVQTGTKNRQQRRARLALHSTRENVLVWDRDLALHRDLHSIEIFAEAGVAMVFLHPDVDVSTNGLDAHLNGNREVLDIDALAPPRCLTIGLNDGMPRYQCHWPWVSGRLKHVLGSVAVVANADGRQCLIDVRTGQPLRWLWPPGWEEVTLVPNMPPIGSTASENSYDGGASSEVSDARYLTQHLHPPCAPHSRSVSPCVFGSTSNGSAAYRAPTPLDRQITNQLGSAPQPLYMRAREDELCVTASFAGRVDRYGARFIILDYTHLPAVHDSFENGHANGKSVIKHVQPHSHDDDNDDVSSPTAVVGNRLSQQRHRAGSFTSRSLASTNDTVQTHVTVEHTTKQYPTLTPFITTPRKLQSSRRSTLTRR